jgi:hypothetical protein
MGIMNSLSVATANLPRAAAALAAALADAAAAEDCWDADAAVELDEELFLREPTTPPTTAATIMIMSTGIPNFIQLLVPFLRVAGVT